jgi:hydrogenase/urease accessory protein HupE
VTANIIRLAILALAILASMGAACAHEARPLSIGIEELAPGHYAVHWRAPASIEAVNAPAVALGAPCRALAEPSREDPLAGRALYDCGAGLERATLSIRYRFYNPSIASLVTIERRSGEISTALLGPEISAWPLPAAESLAGVSRSYFELGVKHILIGIDHILFLIGLLFLAGTSAAPREMPLPAAQDGAPVRPVRGEFGAWRRTLVTITGFTLAHSLTLALVALDAIRVSVPTIEALIALSIVFVAAEIARGDRTTIAWRRPVIVASTFGLLHGAGFAAVLREIGLPQTERVAALFFFNVGVEAGQLILVALTFAGLFLFRRAAIGVPQLKGSPIPLLKAAGYALGLVSAYWFFERAAALFV